MIRKFVTLLTATAVGILLLAPIAEAATWNIDTAHSSVSFKIRHLVSKTSGQFGDWAGVIKFDPENLTEGSAEIVIQTASIDTKNDDRDGHLKSADFFDVENFPTIKFVSTKIEKVKDGYEMVGNLTIKETTKEVRIPFEFSGVGEFHGTRAGFSAQVTIDRKDYDITWNGKLDKGGFVLGDDVHIDIEIEAVQEAS